MPSNTIELIVKATDQASAGIKQIAGQVDELAKGSETLRTILGTALAGFSLDKLVETITEAQTAENELNRAFTAFGPAAGASRQELDEFADSLSKTTTFSSGSLKQAEAQLLQYTSITGQSFTQARDLIADLAAKMGTDAVNAAELLGRALQNPISGMRLLAQAGVVLTPQQRQTIQLLVEEGDSANVLAFELGQLSLHTKGAAEDLENTLGGALKNLKNSFADAFEGQGADVQGLTDSIHALAVEVQDPNFQAGIQNIVSGIITFGGAAAKAALGIADLAKNLGEGLAHITTGADTQVGKVEDKIKDLQELIAQPFLSDDDRSDYVVQLQQAEIELGKLTEAALKSSAATKAAYQDALLQPIDTSKAEAHRITPLAEPIRDATGRGSQQNINDLLLANGVLPPDLARQYLDQTESAVDKQYDKLQTEIAQRAQLVSAGLLSQTDSDAQTHAETQKYLANFDEIQITAKKMKEPLTEIDKLGISVANDIQGAFTNFFESGNLSAHNFLATMLKTFDQIFAKAASQDIVDLLGIKNLFSNSSSSSQVGGLLGALFGSSNYQIGPSNEAIVGAAAGGHVRGPGGPTTDSIPAWLSDGEFVINAKATAKNLPLLKAINSGSAKDVHTLLPQAVPKAHKYAEGGSVSAMPKFAGGGRVSAGDSHTTTHHVSEMISVPKFAAGGAVWDWRPTPMKTGEEVVRRYATGGQVGSSAAPASSWDHDDGSGSFPGTSSVTQRQMAASGGGAISINFNPVHNNYVTADDTSKTLPALTQALLLQQKQDIADLKRQMARNGIKLR